ncbi:MAG: ketopantoate reductase family protein [Desulfotomaculales bacterium]
MKIAVLGAGAMGSLYGAMLAGAGEEVWLVNVWEEHVEAINRRGLTICAGGEERLVRVPATTDPASVGPADLVLVFVKAYSTGQAMRGALSLVGENTAVLTLQNGVGNVEQLCSVVGEGRVLAGSSTFGANMAGPGCVRMAGKGETTLGELNGEVTERLLKIAAAFERAGLSPVISDNIRGVLWTKLLVNVGINPLTAICRVNNGRLLEIPELASLLERAVEEALAVAERKGIRLTVADPVAHVKKVARATADNVSSMRQDMERGRRTEIDVICGAVVKEGAEAGVPTPVNETLALLVRALEKLGGKKI